MAIFARLKRYGPDATLAALTMAVMVSIVLSGLLLAGLDRGMKSA